MPNTNKSGLELDAFTIIVKNKPLSPELATAITEVMVDTSLHMPGMFQIHLADKMGNQNFRWIDSQELKIGAQVQIKATVSAIENRGGNTQSHLLITGEVTALDCDFDARGSATLIVRGYDKSHRLHIGRKTATYLNMTDSAIVDKVARDAGLDVSTTSTRARHEYVLQNNQTDMAFLKSRAARIGYEMRTDETGRLLFRKATERREDGAELVWGRDLMSFRPQISAMRQTSKVVVRAWDVKGKTLVQGQASLPTESKQGGQTLTTDLNYAAHKQTQRVVTDVAALTPEDAKALADALADEQHHDFVRAEGMCMGTPLVNAGRMVKLMGVGDRFSGKYLVTSASHHYTPQGGYTVSFCTSGRNADTLAQLLREDEPNGVGRSGLMQGVVVGLVTNHNDPLGLGRVKVKFPWLGDQIESAWCRMAAPMAGSGRGFYYIPEINDEVLVAFEHGNPDTPYLVGCLWSTTDKPPKPNASVISNGKVNERIIHTRAGHQIIFDDKSGSERITIVDKAQTSIVFDSAKKSLTIDVKGDCTVNVAGQCSIEAKQAIAIKSTSDDVTIECMNFAVKAKAKARIEAAATLDMEGAMVNVKATGPLAVDGKPVQINQSALVVLP